MTEVNPDLIPLSEDGKPEFIPVKGEEETGHPFVLHTHRGLFRNFPGGAVHPTLKKALEQRAREIKGAEMRHQAVNW